jgi:hypothetical protein
VRLPVPGGGEERVLPLPEARGFAPPSKERDPAKKYSPASYTARYGVPLEDAEELVARNAAHQDIERDINRLFSADPGLKRRALDPFAAERERAETIRARDEEAAARRKAEKEAKAKARRDRLRRKMLGMPPDEAGEGATE